MGIDIRTLILVLGITHAIQVVVFLHQNAVNRVFRGVGWWLLWSSAEIAGFGFMLLRGIPSIHFSAIIGQNSLIVLGVTFLYIGILRFFDKKENRALVLSFFAVYFASFFYFLFVNDNIQARGFIISATLAAVSFWSARALWINKTRPVAASANFISMTFLAHGSFHAFRAFMLLTSDPANDIFSPTLINITTYLDAIIAGNVWTFGLIIMINQHLNGEATEATEEIEMIFDANPDAMLITRAIDGLIVKTNEGFCTLTGFSREEAIGKTVYELNIWANIDDRRKVTDELQTKGFSNNIETIFQRKNGDQFIGLLTIKNLNLKGVPHIISVTRDITERKQTEAALANLQKLESLGALAGGIAHDFNNILTAIMGNLSILQSEMEAEGKTLELVEEAQDACRTAKGLAHQLLTFAKGGSPVVKVMDLRPLLEQAAAFAARGSNARCIFDLGEIPLAVNADMEQISQVVQSHVLNAVQAMPQGGDIMIRAAAITLAAGECPPLAAGSYIRVTIRDQGAGIAPEHLPRIFDPYFSTKSAGRGLGLSVCYSIMARHGGFIRAEAKPGNGAVFTLYFPAANAVDIPAEPNPPVLSSCNGRILVMDDEAAVSRLLKRMLERLGYQAETVTEGKAALEVYRQALEPGKPYDAVIMDLTIPGSMGGKETMIKLAMLDPTAKAIVSSGYSNDPVMANYAAHGFSGMLSKPYSLEDVSEVLRQVIGSKKG